MPAAPSSMIGLSRVLSYNLSSFPCLRRSLELCCVVSLCCVSLLHHLIIFVRRRRGSLPPGGKAATSRVSLQLIRCFHSQGNPKTPLLARFKSRSWKVSLDLQILGGISALIFRTSNFRLMDPLLAQQCSLKHCPLVEVGPDGMRAAS